MQNQRGVALIVVVIILALLALLGAVSVKMSRLNQSMSKNSQAKKLLHQSAEVPLALLGKGGANSELAAFMQPTGPMGYLRNDATESDEYVLCYQPMVSSKIFRPGSHRIMVSSGGASGNVSGYCDVTRSNSYTSSRKIIATQLSVTRPQKNPATVNGIKVDAVAIAPFEVSDEGTDNASIGREEPIYFRIYSTSVLPTMSRVVSDSEINGCLKKPIGGQKSTATTDNMRRCLDEADVPYVTQVQDYIYAADVTKN